MDKVLLTVAENRLIADNTYLMVLKGDVSAIKKPGQFVNIALDGFYLRRPISVCDVEGDLLTIIYKVVGKGTKILCEMPCGSKLDVLTGLGNGYDISLSGEKPLLIGGGAGIPPLYMLAKQLLKEGKKPTVIMGFNAENEIYFKKEFEDIGADVIITTVDGSVGIKGFVTDAISNVDHTYFYTCGPEPMLKAVYNVSVTEGQMSFEERMGCGFGGCMGCTCETKYGHKRICKDGPVLLKEEVIW